jgi:hypothetical protein
MNLFRIMNYMDVQYQIVEAPAVMAEGKAGGNVTLGLSQRRRRDSNG